MLLTAWPLTACHVQFICLVAWTIAGLLHGTASLLQVRSVRSVTSVCQDRALSLSAHIAAKHDVDAKKVRAKVVDSILGLWTVFA